MRLKRRSSMANWEANQICFKVVGYYPAWKPDKVDKIRYDKLTHINYAFAIPTSEGELLPLQNAELAERIICNAHSCGVKVLLSIGGWSYNNIPLEPAFMEATDSPEKIIRFGEAIVTMAKEYGFDGIDMDWEHPRNNNISIQQYEGLMEYLYNRLKEGGMLFTAAVLGAVSPEGNVYPDAAAQTEEVLHRLDWINVMAYDGGQYSSFEFAINCAKYWRDIRNVPAHKVVLGVPFYGRPYGIAYADILEMDPEAYQRDMTVINGIPIYYNGIPTITEKTMWALDNIGGIMIWELSEDTMDPKRSLLNAIDNCISDCFRNSCPTDHRFRWFRY
jgi:GH18 family chitinase